MNRAYALFILTIIFGFMPSLGAIAWAQGDEDSAHVGYLDDVSEERYQVTREVIIPPLATSNEVRLNDRIFTQKVIKEINREFHDRFGYDQFEQIAVTSDRYVETGGPERLVPVDEYFKKQRDFGEYLMKQLAEFHVDNYLRNDRSTRNIYKAKEAISNIEVKTKSDYKFHINYRLAANRLSLKLEKPNETFHQQIDLKPDGKEATLRLGYDINKAVKVGTDYAFTDETLTLYGNKRLTQSLSTSITAQSYRKDVGETPKQNRALLGLSWND